MKFAEALKEDLEIKNKQLALKPVLDNTDNNINNFLEELDKNITLELINAKTTLIEQLLGHYNQLLVKFGDSLKTAKGEELIKVKEELNAEFIKNKDNKNLDDKLTLFKNIYARLKASYDDIKEEIKKSLLDVDSTFEYNNLVRKANLNLDRLNDKELAPNTLNDLLTLYKKINNDIDPLDNLTKLISETEILITDKEDNLGVKTITNEKVFDLFAKINDQIISSSFVSKNNFTYAIYTLEDNSKYYAIVKKEEEIKIIEQDFAKLPDLVLTKDNIINTCKIIIKNADIYYDVNEFMRYIEMSYKGQMTKEIDAVILKYKNRLSSFEETLKNQLAFIDNIALLVNKKVCPSYPNIIYNDVPLESYFTLDSKGVTKEVERLIIKVLLNDKVKSSFDTKSILKTLYDQDIIDDLLKSKENKETTGSIALTQELVEDYPSTEENTLTSNYEKIAIYLTERLKELNLLKNSPKINVTITRDDDSIFKDVNTVLDFETAIVICDKVYKEGQGLFAAKDYLRNGENLKFTSKYQARELVMKVDRLNYLKLLLESLVKDYLLNKSKVLSLNFIKTKLALGDINIKELITSLFADDNLLEEVISNYNYNYLNKLSDDFVMAEKALAKETSETLKINNMLIKIKKNITMELLDS